MKKTLIILMASILWTGLPSFAEMNFTNESEMTEADLEGCQKLEKGEAPQNLGEVPKVVLESSGKLFLCTLEAAGHLVSKFGTGVFQVVGRVGGGVWKVVDTIFGPILRPIGKWIKNLPGGEPRHPSTGDRR